MNSSKDTTVDPPKDGKSQKPVAKPRVIGRKVTIADGDFRGSHVGGDTINVYSSSQSGSKEIKIPKDTFLLTQNIFVYEKEKINADSRILIAELQSDITGNQIIVLKVLDDCENARREAQTHFRIPLHPNIVRPLFANTFEYRTQACIYIAMECCDKLNLYEYIKVLRKEKRPYDASMFISFAKQIVDAVIFLHLHNVVNRDLKPQNILLTPDKTVVKICDFGLSKPVRGETTVQTQPQAGTAGWISPEVLNCEEVISIAADIYPLGLILYHLFSYGEHAFGKNLLSLNHYIMNNQNLNLGDILVPYPDLVRKLILQMLQQNPSLRPTAKQVHNRLKEIFDETDTTMHISLSEEEERIQICAAADMQSNAVLSEKPADEVPLLSVEPAAIQEDAYVPCLTLNQEKQEGKEITQEASSVDSDIYDRETYDDVEGMRSDTTMHISLSEEEEERIQICAAADMQSNAVLSEKPADEVPLLSVEPAAIQEDAYVPCLTLNQEKQEGKEITQESSSVDKYPRPRIDSDIYDRDSYDDVRSEIREDHQEGSTRSRTPQHRKKSVNKDEEVYIERTGSEEWRPRTEENHEDGPPLPLRNNPPPRPRSLLTYEDVSPRRRTEFAPRNSVSSSKLDAYVYDSFFSYEYGGNLSPSASARSLGKSSTSPAKQSSVGKAPNMDEDVYEEYDPTLEKTLGKSSSTRSSNLDAYGSEMYESFKDGGSLSREGKRSTGKKDDKSVISLVKKSFWKSLGKKSVKTQSEYPIGSKTVVDIAFTQIRIDDVILRHPTGDISKGVWAPPPVGGQQYDVLTKAPEGPVISCEELVREAAVMRELRHQSVLRLLGVVSGNPTVLVMEHPEYGSLYQYLTEGSGKKSALEDQCNMASEVAGGMCYMEGKNYVHCDLHSRNVYVFHVNKPVCKVGGFHYASQLKDGKRMCGNGDCYAIKWLAPEVRSDNFFTAKCDVWSFGILLTEIFSRGKEPYESMSNAEAEKFLLGGYRMRKESNWPNPLYKMMLNCWDEVPVERPKFARLWKEIQDL